uniref:Lymphokine-activated killer T-cell-originated protein kinase homolog n=1 Tax=Caligus rogercresseyi TaxID=217165 RepID=C1BPL0_CALRO|nr:Lymphokine-activated killer T-cell-originated protein kinase homolog [Caligus rogercresseyi]
MSSPSDCCSPPVEKRIKIIRECASPDGPPSPTLHIPPSPCLKTLGFGTGVKILLHERVRQDGSSLSPWALKKVNRRHASGLIAKRLEEEASILKDIKHPHIIGYRGFKTDSEGCRILALEKGERSLSEVLEERLESEKPGPLEPEFILRVMKSVISALHYLHTDVKRLHGDIKAANVILVGGKREVKLCDFGVSIKLDATGERILPGCVYTGTEAWNPIEVIGEETDITPKADIFAFGCLLYEMLSLRPPHVDKLVVNEDDDVDDSIDDEEYIESLGSRPELPQDSDVLGDEYEFVLSVFYACTEEDQEKRPSSKKILQLIEDHEKSLG